MFAGPRKNFGAQVCKKCQMAKCLSAAVIKQILKVVI